MPRKREGQRSQEIKALRTRVEEAERQAADSQRTEVALREGETRLRLALAAARMGTWDWDIASNRVTYSDELGPLFGLPRGGYHPTYEAFLNAVHPDDRERVARAVTLALDAGADYGLEFRVVWPDGTVHWLANRGQVSRDDTDRAVRMPGVAMDITERRQAEELARRAEALQAVAALANGAAHEINNPLTIIQGHLSILAQALPEESREAERIAEAIAAVGRIHAIVNQMTQIVRLEHIASESRLPPTLDIAKSSKVSHNPGPLTRS